MGWATVVSCDVACHVMSLDVLVMSFDAMWLLVLCHVTWCTAMSCDVRSCEELSSVVPCNGMECYEVKLPLFSKQLLCTSKYYSSTTPTLLCTSKYYSSTTPTLLQYYSVLLCTTTPVLLCTTKYDSSTTKYDSSTTKYYSSTTTYYSVLQSTTPVLLCTTKHYSCTTPVLLRTTKYYSSTTVTTKYYSITTTYYSSTTPYYSTTTKYYKVLLPYYKVLLQYCSVLLQYYSVLQSATKYYSVLLQYYSSTTTYYSSTTPYYKVLLQYYKVLLQYSGTTLKRHLQCAKQQASPSNLTKYCACHAKGMSWLILLSNETSFTMRRATGITCQPHQILRLPRKRNVMIDPSLEWNVIYNARSNGILPPTSPNTAPATQKECHDWSFSRMKRHLQCAKQQASPCNLTKYCACHAKGMTVLFLLTYETSFTMRGATGISLQPHQILRLPRQRSVMIDLHHIWNVIYNARSNRHQPPTSPNTAPATQNCNPKS